MSSSCSLSIEVIKLLYRRFVVGLLTVEKRDSWNKTAVCATFSKLTSLDVGDYYNKL